MSALKTREKQKVWDSNKNGALIKSDHEQPESWDISNINKKNTKKQVD